MPSTEQLKFEASESETLPLIAEMPSEGSHALASRENWVHTTRSLILAWLLVSVPLVIWDFSFCLLRPLTFPGGSLAWPVWVPYEIYMRTDYVYGWKAFKERSGFTSAQAFMNIPETLLYIQYLYIVYLQGNPSKATFSGSKSGFLAQRSVVGQAGTWATIVGFAAAVMTFSKTALYGLNEAFSGWSNVGHNEWTDLVIFWILPNGAWLVASACMTFAFGNDIMRAMSAAAGAPQPEWSSLKKTD